VVEDQGFAMTLDAEIPNRIRAYLLRESEYFERAASDPKSLWAIHPGGRAILDTVAETLALSRKQLAPARQVLENFGNMSSASVMFVFEQLLREASSDEARPGAAMAFGPGLTIEAMEFTTVPRTTRSTAADTNSDETTHPEWFAKI
jgi:predicted naringenin-chalcone synthase